MNWTNFALDDITDGVLVMKFGFHNMQGIS